MGKASRLRKERQNLVLANREAATCYSSHGKDKDDKISMSEKDDKISKLHEQNQVLITKTESLKEEREAGKKMEDNWKEAEKDLRKDIYGIQQELNKEEHSDSAWQYRVTENYFNEQNEMLDKEVDGARCLFEMQNHRIEYFLVENARLVKQLEEKEEQKTTFESFHAEFTLKYRELEEKHSDLLKENGEQEKIILTLQREHASIGNETSLFIHSLNEETKRSREISAKCLESDERVLYLESQSLELETELASAKSAYDEVVVQLNKIKEDMNKLSNDLGRIKEEKETLQQNLMLQLSINKELEENLLSTKSSFEKLKDSASKREQEIAMLQRQLLNVAVGKDGGIFELQCELSAMVIQLADLQDKLSSTEEEKMFLEEKNTEIERGQRASEEEQVHLKARIGELERDLDIVTKDLESCRVMSVEKERQLADSQYQLSELAQAKKCLQEENNSLRTELSKYKCIMVSEEIGQISDGTRQLEIPLESVEGVESKDIQLQQLMAERQHLLAHVHGNENSNSVQEDGITENGHVNQKPNSAHGIAKPKDAQGNGKPKNVHHQQPPKRGQGKQKSRK